MLEQAACYPWLLGVAVLEQAACYPWLGVTVLEQAALYPWFERDGYPVCCSFYK